MNSDKKYTAVIGVDFGTGGYAIGLAFTKGKTWITPHSTIRNGVVHKNSAAVLCKYGEEGKETDLDLVAMGYNALSSFADMDPGDQAGVLLFQSVKMDLYGDTDYQTEAVNGDKLPTEDVIRLALRRIHKEALACCQTASGVSPSNLSEHHLRWVITVPAIWSDAAKQIMRKSAIAAGIQDCDLLLALEPEAASIACQMTAGPDTTVSVLDTNQAYMVVDAGKGTVDITVHQLDDDGKLQDIAIPRGNALGSGTIDARFIELLERSFGAPEIDEFRQKFPADFLDLMNRFESVKIRTDFDLTNTDMVYHIDLGPKFLYWVMDERVGPMPTLPNGVTIDERYRLLGLTPQALYTNLFETSIEGIKALVSEILMIDRVFRTCRTIFLVGGYGDCPFLYKAIENAIDESGLDIRIFRPMEPALAVVNGAVAYGQRPDALSSRLAQKTIAVAVTVPYDESVHAGRTRTRIDGEYYCTGVLDVLVTKGKRLKSDQLIEHSYLPVIDDRNVQNLSIVRIYQSNRTDIQYTDDDGVVLAGELVVAMPTISTGNVVKLQLSFGSTEIKATSSMGTGLPMQCTLDFYGRTVRRNRQIMVSVDVCFVLDCTGSMAAYIEASKDHVLAIAKNVIKRLSNMTEACQLRFAFVAYRDFCDKPSDRISYINFTNDFSSVKAFISRQEAFGGGDGPEDLLGGLNQAVEMNWNATNRFIVLVADAPCHGLSYSGESSGDAHPAGNPDGLDAIDVFDRLNAINTQMIFTRICSHTDIMMDKFKKMHPITEIDMSTTDCISQFGRTLSSEIIGHIKRTAI